MSNFQPAGRGSGENLNYLFSGFKGYKRTKYNSTIKLGS